MAYTHPTSTTAITAQSLTGSQIQSSYSDTGDGTGVALGDWPVAVASGTVAVAGNITTMTVKMVAIKPGNAAAVDCLSHKQGSTGADAVEWTFTAAEDVSLLTTDHLGADMVYVHVKGDVDGTSGDVATFKLKGMSL